MKVAQQRDRDLDKVINDLSARVSRLERQKLQQVQCLTFAHKSGPYPASVTVTTSADNHTLMVLWSPTAFVASAGSIGQCLLTITDASGNTVGTETLGTYFNNATEHDAFPLGFHPVTSLPQGTYTCTVTVATGTSDSNDRCTFVVLEVPQ